MGYHAKILAHSTSRWDVDLLTVEARYPRIVLAETVTHRQCRDTFGEFDLTFSDRTTTEDISKNSASSRAIPISRMIQNVIDDPYVPEKFSKNGKGMQAAGYWVPGDAEYDEAKRVWLNAREVSIGHVQALMGIGGEGVHKQEANRLLEPWMWVTQILTADGRAWDNFFALRCDEAAHPAFQKIARMIYLEKRKSEPELLGKGQWHLPFVAKEERAEFRFSPGWETSLGSLPDLIRYSAARCAWVSYENHDRNGSPEQMDATFNRLMAADPKHASPVEHQATPVDPDLFNVFPKLRSNLFGWLQARKLVQGERAEKYEPSESEIASWGLGT